MRGAKLSYYARRTNEVAAAVERVIEMSEDENTDE